MFLSNWLKQLEHLTGMFLLISIFIVALFVFVFYLCYFLLIKNISIFYAIYSIIAALMAGVIYVSVWILNENDKDQELLSSYLLLLVFFPAVIVALSNIPCVSRLFTTISIVLCVFIIFSCFIFLDYWNDSVKKIGNDPVLKIFTLSNGLIMISGFVALGRNVLFLIKNLTGIISFWIIIIYIFFVTFIGLVNSAYKTNFWTKKNEVVIVTKGQSPISKLPTS